MLSKSWENFMFWIISYLRKLNKYKGQFSDHILYPYHKHFYVYHRPYNQPNDKWKQLSLILDSSKNNDGSISFFHIFQWSSAFTRFPSTSKYLGHFLFCTFRTVPWSQMGSGAKLFTAWTESDQIFWNIFHCEGGAYGIFWYIVFSKGKNIRHIKILIFLINLTPL